MATLSSRSGFTHLDDSDREEALAFLAGAPERNVVMLCNIEFFGMDSGERPLDGYYFGRRNASELTALGVLYNLGSLFFYVAKDEGVKGIASHLAAGGMRPYFTQGLRPQVEILLEELRALGELQPHVLLSEWQVLRGGINPKVETRGARPARIDELDTLVRLGRAMHREVFAGEDMDEDSLKAMLTLQIDLGGAFVYEHEGELVSKAEATMAPPHAALIGGVYTVPEFRGRGLSTRCVAALSQHLLGRVSAVTLSVESDNPSAFRQYRNVGFIKEADWMVVSFEKP